MSNTSEIYGLGPLLSFEPPSLIPPTKRGGPWTLAADWTVVFLGNVIIVPEGFETDGASIPVWLRPICGNPLQSPRIFAAIVHDYLYMTHDLPRDMADALYRDMLCFLGYPVQGWVEYPFIRAAGWLHW